MGCLQVLPAYAAQEDSGQTSADSMPDPAPPDSETSPPADTEETGNSSGLQTEQSETPDPENHKVPDDEADSQNPQQAPPEDGDEDKNKDETQTEEAPGKTEYEASLEQNTVKIHCSEDAFPAGTELKVSPLAADLPDLQKLDSEEGMSAFGLDIQFLSEDGQIIEPEIPVQAEITVSANEFGSEIEAEDIRLFHAETDGLKQVDTASMVLKDGIIKAVFTADSFSPFIFQAKAKEKAAEEAKPDEETADDADSKDQPQAQSEDPEPDIYSLYCYTLIPGMTFNPQVIANAEWNGMGVGEVIGLPAPQIPSGTSKNYIHDPGVQIIYPIDLNQSTYPDITATSSEDGATATYKYAAPGSGNEYKEGYYTIDWNQLVEASGANSGHNNYNPVVYAGVPTYHLNGVIYLNQKHLITVSFYAQIPGQQGFTFIDATRVEKGSTGSLLESDHLVPELDPQTYPEYRFYNGTLYRLKYWSASQDVAASFASENLSAFNQPMTGNTAFYAGYEPIEANNLVISKEVSGKGAEPDRQFIFTLDLNAGKDFGTSHMSFQKTTLNPLPITHLRKPAPDSTGSCLSTDSRFRKSRLLRVRK